MERHINGGNQSHILVRPAAVKLIEPLWLRICLYSKISLHHSGTQRYILKIKYHGRKGTKENIGTGCIK